MRLFKIIFYFLCIINVLELISGIGIVILAHYPKAGIEEVQVQFAYGIVAHACIMLVGLSALYGLKRKFDKAA